MRRMLVALAVAGALAAPAAVQAGTTVQKIPYEDDVEICNGDTVHIAGTLLDSYSETATPSGGYIFRFHDNPQGMTGVDTTTGTVFHATGVTREVDIETPPGGYTTTFVNNFHLQATTDAESFIVREVYHLTVKPDGTVAVELDHLSIPCPFLP